MIHARVAVLPLLALALSAQSVISTHSGVLYFFEGSVFLGNEPVEQKFGKFPDIGEDRELRTEHGRAEVLLTPGVVLRAGDNSAIHILSSRFSDTRVELLGGSAIVEANDAPAGTAVTLIHKNWQVRVPRQGVYRIDSEPPQMRVYRGEAEVCAKGETAKVTVREDELLPLAAVLVPEPSRPAADDAFKNWAMSRSQAISADNAIAAEIVDDPSQIDNSSLALASFSYFPMTGIPYLGITNPYGVSFWSPYQSHLSTIYFPAYTYGRLYPGWPSGAHIYPRRMFVPGRIGTGYTSGITTPRMPPFATPPRATTYHPAPAPRPAIHAGRR